MISNPKDLSDRAQRDVDSVARELEAFIDEILELRKRDVRNNGIITVEIPDKWSELDVQNQVMRKYEKAGWRIKWNSSWANPLITTYSMDFSYDGGRR